jgi:hypothetical protein
LGKWKVVPWEQKMADRKVVQKVVQTAAPMAEQRADL